MILRVIMSSTRALCCLPSRSKNIFPFRSMKNNTIFSFGFRHIQNNKGIGKGYQPQPLASAAIPCLDLDYFGYHENLIQ